MCLWSWLLRRNSRDRMSSIWFGGLLWWRWGCAISRCMPLPRLESSVDWHGIDRQPPRLVSHTRRCWDTPQQRTFYVARVPIFSFTIDAKIPFHLYWTTGARTVSWIVFIICCATRSTVMSAPIHNPNQNNNNNSEEADTTGPTEPESAATASGKQNENRWDRSIAVITDLLGNCACRFHGEIPRRAAKVGEPVRRRDGRCGGGRCRRPPATRRRSGGQRHTRRRYGSSSRPAVQEWLCKLLIP